MAIPAILDERAQLLFGRRQIACFDLVERGDERFRSTLPRLFLPVLPEQIGTECQQKQPYHRDQRLAVTSAELRHPILSNGVVDFTQGRFVLGIAALPQPFRALGVGGQSGALWRGWRCRGAGRKGHRR